jgi:undecaprenyl-diphosphatase
MALFTRLGTNSEFFVRFGGFVCSIVSLVLVYFSGKKLVPENARFPWEVLAIANLTLLFSTGSIIQTPDTPMLLFWTAALYFGIQIVTGGKPFWWYLWGVALGLGLLSKYTAVLLVPCQFAYLLISPTDRHWLARKEPYVALVIGAIIFSPVILWNWQHQWISFVYQSKYLFSLEREKAGIKLLEYIGAQAMIITPGIFAAFIFFSIKGLFLSVRERVPEYMYLVLFSWPVLLFFAISSATGDRAEANWPAPSYVAGLLLMWAVYCRTSEDRKRSSRLLLHAALGLGVAMNAVMHIHVIKPIIPLTPNRDLTRQIHGWRNLGEQIDSLVEKHRHGDGYFLVAERGTALAEAVFYSKKIDIGINFTRPERYIFLGDTSYLKGKNALILVPTMKQWILEKYERHFQRLTLAGTHESRYRGDIIKEYSFYIVLGEGYRGGWS